jgi:chitodextrinase
MKYLVQVTVGILFSLPAIASAVVSNDFIFRVSVGDDVIPPTTPVLLSASPIAPTQIDVDWSISTDNWIFGGYVLLRDGTSIATTTLTSYNDTGLTPETMYTYEVYAFDSVGNISTTSNSLATTTLAVPVIPPTPVSTSNPSKQATQTLRLDDFSITPGSTETQLNWVTNIPTRYLVRWGRTDSYTGGYIRNESYGISHVTSITDLEPGTRYEYEVVGYSPAGITIILKKGSFTTIGQDIPRVVPNVERLIATVSDDDVRLDFSLPVGEPGARIRVVRSHLGFPVDLYDGAVVFDGVARSVFDGAALKGNEVQYYTVFVIASDGSVSSGAVVMAVRQSAEGTGAVPVVPGEGDPSVGPGEDPETLVIDLLETQDIILTQEHTSYTFLDNDISLSHTAPFTLSIPREALPKHLKSILVTLLDPTDQRRSYSFLLRLNKTGTAYEATIAPLNVLGTSRLLVEVYDFDQLVIGRYSKQIVFSQVVSDKAVVIFPDLLLETASRAWSSVLLILGLLLGILCIFWFIKRRAEDKE